MAEVLPQTPKSRRAGVKQVDVPARGRMEVTARDIISWTKEGR